MPQVVPALTSFFLAAGGTTALTASVTAFALAQSLAYATTSLLLNKAFGLLNKRGKTGETRGLEVASTDSNSLARFIYGEVRVSGVSAIPPVTSGANAEKLHQILMLAAHEIDSIQTYYFDQTALPAPAAVSGAAGDGLISSGVYASAAWVRLYRGTATQAVDFILNAAFPSQWLSTARARGFAYVALTYSWGRGRVYKAVPQATFLVRGAKLYDPRLDSTNGGAGAHRYTDSTTWAYSNNPALCWANHQIASYGYGRDPATRVNWATVAAAANICDALVANKDAGTSKRYTCNGTLVTEQGNLLDNEQKIIDSMLGRRTFVGGKWCIYAGGWTAASYAIEKTDWMSIDSIVAATPFDQGGRFNEVHNFYVDPNRNWQRVECYVRRNPTYKSDDAGQLLPIEMEQPLCTNESEAQRKAEFILRASRNGIQLAGTLPPRYQKIVTYDVVTLNFAELGWTSKLFRVVAVSLNEDGSVRVALVEEQEADWTDLATGDYGTPSLSAVPATNPTTPSAPQNFTITPDFGLLKFDWDAPLVTPLDTRYRVLQSPGSHWIASSGTTLWEGDASDASVRVTNPATPFWYHVQAYIGSYDSPFTPTSYGLIAYPYSSPEGYRGNRLLPDGEFATANNSYWDVAASNYVVNRTGGLGNRGYIRLWINNGAGNTFRVSPKNVYEQDRMSTVGSAWLPATNGQQFTVQSILRVQSWDLQAMVHMYAGLFLSPSSFTAFRVGGDTWDIPPMSTGSYRSFVSSFDTNFNVNSPINAVRFIVDDNAAPGTAVNTMQLDVMQLQVTVS